MLRRSQSYENKRKLKEQSFIFNEVPASQDYDTDYPRVDKNRTNAYYSKAISWAMVFLNHKSFSTFAGNTLAMEFLFPMEKIFELYVYKILRKSGKLGSEPIRNLRSQFR